MPYRLMGHLHARLLGLRDDRGQGTVEYVGLILLIAGVLAAVIKAGPADGGKLAKTIVDKLKDAVAGTGGGAKG